MQLPLPQRKPNGRVAFGFGLLFAASLLNAQSDNIGSEDLQYLQFLMDQSVTVASAREEKVSDAPGAVTAWTDQDIQKFGVNTIGELGDMTPGYSSAWDAMVQRFETRGGTSSLNEKHLVLLDGMPIQHVRNGMAMIEDQLPLLFAKRVEFLRGPASALYGIGAFNGVINMVPKSLDKEGTLIEGKMQLGMEAGSPDDISSESPEEFFVHKNLSHARLFQQRYVGNIIVNKDEIETQVGYGFYRRESSEEFGYEFDGSDFTIPHGPYRNAKTTHFGRLQTKINQGALKGLGLGFIGLYSWDNYGQGWATTSDEGNYHIWSTYIPYVRYDKQIAENMNLMAYAKLNYSQEKGSQTNTAGWWSAPGTMGNFNFDVLTKNVEAYAKYSWDIIQPVSIIAGVNFDARWQDSANSYTQQINAPANVDLYGKVAYTYSAFLQARAEAPVLNGLIFTGGVRSDNGNLNSAVYHQLSPRAAAVLKILENLNFKAMYGTALKPPGPDNISHNQEKFVDIQTYNDTNSTGLTLTLPDLKAEMIHTLEANLTFSNEKLYLSGTGFYNIIKNSLQRDLEVFRYLERAASVLDTFTSDYWHNSTADAFAAGFELESQLAPIEPLRIWLNGSFTRTWKDAKTAEGEDTTVYDAIADIPIAKSNLGVCYTAPFGLSAAAMLKGIWALVRPSSGENYWDDYDPGYWLVDLNLRQPISKQFSVELNISNLLNKEYYNLRRTVPMPNRIMSLALSTSF